MISYITGYTSTLPVSITTQSFIIINTYLWIQNCSVKFRSKTEALSLHSQMPMTAALVDFAI